MALLVFMWAYFFANKSKVINDVAVLVLLVLTCLMFYQIDFGRPISSKPALSFMMVVEMSIAMPVSWLPLIGDYTSQGENSRGVFWSTFLGYFVASSSMFILGLLITLFTGKDIIEFISSFAMPLAACAIIVLSTVTTTFLDIFSAVESSRQLFSIKRPGLVTAIYCGIGFALSLYFPIEDYESFLLTIGSVFIPVYSIVIMNYFLPEPGIRRNFVGVASVVGGCVLYNYFLTKSILSPTLLILGILPLLYLPVVKLVNRNSIPESGQ
ncbi:MAG TPA: putative hydroxymethylpyrimidine transporter CytX, partial [Bacillota bacterium]|nr:putative hydroxymethylpyrimidine transporter CytX [Bacillota bacterium]